MIARVLCAWALAHTLAFLVLAYLCAWNGTTVNSPHPRLAVFMQMELGIAAVSFFTLLFWLVEHPWNEK